MKLKIAYCLMVTILIISGCDDDSIDKLNDSSNHAPIIDAGEDKIVIVNQTITLTGDATDSDGEIVSYEWRRGEDTLSDNKSFNYLPTKIGVDTLTFIVTDDDGDSSKDTIKITVKTEEDNSDFNVENNSSDEEIIIKNELS